MEKKVKMSEHNWKRLTSSKRTHPPTLPPENSAVLDHAQQLQWAGYSFRQALKFQGLMSNIMDVALLRDTKEMSQWRCEIPHWINKQASD